MKVRDHIFEGNKFGDWTVKGSLSKRGGSKYVKCLCKCGLLQDVLIFDLHRGTSTRCRSCAITKRNIKHGQNCHDQITYEYHLWKNLKHGKKIREDWRDSFELFFKDVGKRPDPNFILLKKDHKFLLSKTNFFWGHPRLKFFKDIENKKFSKWLVLAKCFESKGVKWLCRCDCGREDYVLQTNLLNGISKRCRSCAMLGKNPKKHGHSNKSIYRIFHGMKGRCYNENHKNFIHYGGRGIKICDRWLTSVENFIFDMGERPSADHSIDRIDVNGSYSPENCKWSTQKEQTQNQRKMSDLQSEVFKLKEEIKMLKYTLPTPIN